MKAGEIPAPGQRLVPVSDSESERSAGRWPDRGSRSDAKGTTRSLSSQASESAAAAGDSDASLPGSCAPGHERAVTDARKYPGRRRAAVRSVLPASQPQCRSAGPSSAVRVTSH
jgi:hypothetical protein